MSRLQSSVLTSLLLIAPPVVLAQTDNETTNQEPVLEKKAMERLEALAGSIPQLRAPGNRLLLSMWVADLLWARDEKRARDLVENVTREMSSIVAEVDPVDQEAHELTNWIHQQRQQIIDRLARHDPELALTFLQATRLPPPQWNLNSERDLEIHLASLIAAKNPEMSLRLARATLSKGVSYNLLNLLSQLHQKDSAAARTFHREVIDRIDKEDFNANGQAVNVFFNLLTSFQPPAADEQTYREFIDQLSARILRVTSGDRLGYQSAQNIHQQLRGAMPQFEKYSPARAQALKEWSQRIGRTFDRSWRIRNELNDLYQNASGQEIVAMASRYPAEMRPDIYQQAIWKVFNNGDIELARQMTIEYLADHAQRQMLANIENRFLWKASNENNVAETRRLLLKTKPGNRFQIMTQLAGRLAGSGNRDEALGLLTEAKDLLPSIQPNSRRLSAQLELAQHFVPLDPDQSFSMLQLVITQLNELVGAAVVLDGIENRYLRDEEWMISGHSTLSNFVNTLDQHLGRLAARDFERAWDLSEQIKRPEIRLKTQLAVVQGVLNGAKGDLPLRGRNRLVILQ